jgi:TetR/AcrR family transcriptional regulator, transcriptional repressor for nem operon
LGGKNSAFSGSYGVRSELAVPRWWAYITNWSVWKDKNMVRNAEHTRERILDEAEKLVMAQGFAGTSIDGILKAAELTKGAFFHHFKGKTDLARALIERNALRDLGIFEDFAAQAEAESEDPLEQMLLFLQAFEKHVRSSSDPLPGCMYATYTYESMQFEPAIMDFVADTLRKWTSIYVRKFQNILDEYEPALTVSARQLAEMIVSIVEGGLVLQRAYGDTRMTSRQSEQFRNYLKLLFNGRKRKAGKERTPQTAKQRSNAKVAKIHA